MKELFAKLNFVVSEPMQTQIRRHVRNLALAGALVPGDRLPSTHELARLWDTHLQTVQLALTPLVREGLLTRINRVGTFVAETKPKLKCVGLYYREDFLSGDGSLFIQSLHGRIKELLNARDIETDVWIDPRPDAEERAGAWQPFAEAAQRKEFQAFMAPAADHDLLRWLTKLPVPGAYLTSANVPGRVDGDLAQMVELGLKQLAAQGCRSVGFITSTTTNPMRDDAPHTYDLMFSRFIDAASRVGLRVQNEWTCSPASYINGGSAQEAYGYQAFHRLWDLPGRPDGLLVSPDTTARGVILAITERAVRVPDDLKVAFHKNEGIDLLCPFPATMVISSERETAQALISQVEKQFRGEPCRPIWIGCRVESQKQSNQPQQR